MSYLSIGEFAEAIGKTTQTIRNWDNSGYLKPAFIGLGGHRYYTQEQVDKYLGRKNNINQKTIGYCRVLTQNQTEELEQQVSNIKTYCLANGYQFEIITDIGSEESLLRDGLSKLVDKVVAGEVSKIVIMNRNILADKAFEFIESLCIRLGTLIEIIDSTKEGD